MGKQAKPKAVSGTRSDRSNGKKPKQNPRSNEKVATGRTYDGYSPEAIARRKRRRQELNLKAPIFMTPIQRAFQEAKLKSDE